MFSDCLVSVFELSTNNAGAVSISDVCLISTLLYCSHIIERQQDLLAECAIIDITEYGNSSYVCQEIKKSVITYTGI